MMTIMTTIHVQRIGDKALLPQSELEQLVDLVRLHQGIAVEVEDDDMPTSAMMQLAEQSGAFDFWKEEGGERLRVIGWRAAVSRQINGCG